MVIVSWESGIALRRGLTAGAVADMGMLALALLGFRNDNLSFLDCGVGSEVVPLLFLMAWALVGKGLAVGGLVRIGLGLEGQMVFVLLIFNLTWVARLPLLPLLVLLHRPVGHLLLRLLSHLQGVMVQLWLVWMGLVSQLGLSLVRRAEVFLLLSIDLGLAVQVFTPRVEVVGDGLLLGRVDRLVLVLLVSLLGDLPLISGPLLLVHLLLAVVEEVLELEVDRLHLLLREAVLFTVHQTLNHLKLTQDVVSVEPSRVYLFQVVLKQVVVHHVEASLIRPQVQNGAEHLEQVLVDVFRHLLLVAYHHDVASLVLKQHPQLLEAVVGLFKVLRVLNEGFVDESEAFKDVKEEQSLPV